MNLKAIKRPAEDPSSVQHLIQQVEKDIKGLVPAEYVPPKDRTAQIGRLTVNAVNSFAELPTAELDGLIKGMELKLAQIKEKAAQIREDYVRRTTELRESVERLNQACMKGEIKMGELYEQLDEIYKGQPQLPEPPVPEKGAD